MNRSIIHFDSSLIRISEIHGNMNIEVCSGSCTGDKRVYIRNYDVTKRTSFRRHYTGRH